MVETDHTMLIRNPYAKKTLISSSAAATAASDSRSTATTSNNTKRPQRPWEEAAAPTTHIANSNCNNFAPADHAKRIGIAASKPQRPLHQGNENRNVNQPPPSAGVAATSADDDFDPFDACDIDWDAAVRQVESVSAKKTIAVTSVSNHHHQSQPKVSAVNHPYSASPSSSYFSQSHLPPLSMGTSPSTCQNTSTRENPYKKPSQTASSAMAGTTSGKEGSASSSSTSANQNSPSRASNNDTTNLVHHQSSWSLSSPRPATSYRNVRQQGLHSASAAATMNVTFDNHQRSVLPPPSTVVQPDAAAPLIVPLCNNMPQNPQQSVSTRPPRVPPPSMAQGPLPCSNAHALASLRPSNWTSTSTAAKQCPQRPTHVMNSNSTTGVTPISLLSSPSHAIQQQQRPPGSCTTTHQQLQQQQQQPMIQQQPVLPQNQVGLPPPLQFDPCEILPVTSDGHQKDLVHHADVSGTLLNGWTLFSHQKRAILKGLRMRRLILALDMGLGKTLTASVWAKAFHKTMMAHIVVICPISVQHEWQRTFENAIGLLVQDLNQTKSKKKNADKDDGTTRPPSQTPAVTIYSWAKVPTVESLNFDSANQKFVVIADECHSIQSMQAARTKATLTLVLDSNCVGVMMLSGTPMKNGKPSNLFPLLRAVKNPLGKHQRAFEARFCEGRKIQYGRSARPVWEAKGSSNLQQLKALADPHILHLPKEIIKDLPPKTRIVEHVPVSSRNHQKHQIALHELARIVAATKQTRSNNKNNYDANSNSTTENSGDPVMGALSKLRKACSMAKVDAAVSRAKQILQKEAAVVIFTDFQEVAENICNQLIQGGWKGELLTGKTPSDKRQGMVDNFQSGISPVFVGTFGAAGAGITLHAAHTILLVDRPWTPGDTFQAEDRVRRIGQKHAVTCIWLSAFELDKQMDAMIQHKDQTSKSVLDSSAATGTASPSSWVTAGAPAPKISIDQLLKSLIPDNSPSGHLVQTSMLQFSQADEG